VLVTVDYEWFREELEPYLSRDRWLVAYSGGLDSSVLLRLLVEIRNSGDSAPSLEAVHVNHGLSAEAHQWQQHCIDTCAQYQVPLTVIGVDVVDDGLGLEAAARQARYQQFEQILSVRALLLMAHHLDDQVETFFLRLLRGSGVEIWGRDKFSGLY
jgi:tRNA(Ile)-lysidine synthase